MLREEAFVAERPDAQVDGQARRFRSDRTRTRFAAAPGRLEVSKIFEWHGDDFSLGQRAEITFLPDDLQLDDSS